MFLYWLFLFSFLDLIVKTVEVPSLFFFIITLEIIAGLSKLKPHSLGTLLSSVITDPIIRSLAAATEKKICKEKKKKCINKSMSFDRILTLQQILKSENNFIAKKSEKILN